MFVVVTVAAAPAADAAADAAVTVIVTVAARLPRVLRNVCALKYFSSTFKF